MAQLYASIKAFLSEPFKTPMSLWQYVAIVGITIVAVLLWSFVLKEIERGVREV